SHLGAQVDSIIVIVNVVIVERSNRELMFKLFVEKTKTRDPEEIFAYLFLLRNIFQKMKIIASASAPNSVYDNLLQLFQFESCCYYYSSSSGENSKSFESALVVKQIHR